MDEVPMYEDGIARLVKIGARVELALISESGAAEPLAVDLVRAEAADFAAGFLGANTPLGRAIVGQAEGTTVPYRAADVVAVRILRVTPSQRTPDADAATARQAAVRRAVARYDAEEMARLALTFSSKWGDWNPSPETSDGTP